MSTHPRAHDKAHVARMILRAKYKVGTMIMYYVGASLVKRAHVINSIEWSGHTHTYFVGPNDDMVFEGDIISKTSKHKRRQL